MIQFTTTIRIRAELIGAITDDGSGNARIYWSFPGTTSAITTDVTGLSPEDAAELYDNATGRN